MQLFRCALAFFYLSIILLIPAFAADPGTISGTISDSAGAMIGKAEIVAVNSQTGTRYKTESSEKGDFTLPEMPAGEYELRASLPGFRQYSQSGIRLAASQNLHLDMHLEIGNISETVVVNSDAPLTKLDNPQLESAALQLSTSKVERLQIERQGAKTVMDALDYIPGGWTETRGRKEKQLFSVRGQRYPYPEYAVDGALFREFYQVPYFLSAENVERVEVLRSSAALLNGISGLAGVINIVPREYEHRETNWLAEYGSMDSYRVRVSHGQRFGDFSYGVGMGGFHTDGPEGRHGAEKMVDLFANASWNPGNFSIRATAFYDHGKRELVQAEPPAAQQYRVALQKFDPTQEVSGTVKILYRPTDWASTQLTVGYSNRHNRFADETTSVPAYTSDYDHEWNWNLIQSIALSRKNVIRLGANYNHWIAPYGIRFYSGRRSDLETYSVAVVDEQSIGRLLLDGGLRYQRTYINEYGAFNVEGTSTAFKKVPSVTNQWEPAEPSGSLGATYSLTENLSLRANFLAGTVEPRRGTLTVDLAPPLNEHRKMWDVGFRLVRDRFGEISLTGFYLMQKNAIVLSGTTKTVNGQIMELYQNRDQNSQGLEFEFRSRPFFEDINLFFNMTAMNPHARLNGKMGRDAETPKLITGAGVMGKKAGFDYNFFWKYISGYENSRFAASPVPQPLGAFHTANVTVGRAFGGREKIRVYLEVENITDNKYSTVVGYPDYGRRFALGIRQAF